MVAEELELESRHWNCAPMSPSPGLPSIRLSSQLLAASPTTLGTEACAGSEKAPRYQEVVLRMGFSSYLEPKVTSGAFSLSPGPSTELETEESSVKEC